MEADAVSVARDRLTAISRADMAAGAICRGVEMLAAIALAAEVATLLLGVTSRYVFRHPIIWTDEIAGTLFLWLAMAGAVLALERQCHLRMTALVNKARRPDLFAALSTSIIVVFLAIVLGAAWDYASDEAYAITPTLEISGLWRGAAIPAGIMLMAILSILRIIRSNKLHILGSLAAIALVIGMLFAGREFLKDIGNYNLLVFFAAAVPLLVFAGVPIAFSFGISTALYIVLIPSAPETVLVSRMAEGMSHFILLSVPLFVLLGLLIEMTGMAEAMIGLLARLLGHLRGGLSFVLLGSMYLVSGISGAKTADMAAIAPILFPEMRKRNADPGELAALLATTGAMTETIPPSLVLITIGSVTDVSIAALFTGGLMPALVLAVFVGAVIWRRSRKDDLSNVVRARPAEILRALWIAVPAMILPFIIRAAVLDGIATATEVSVVGVAYSTIIGLFVYRKFDWKRLFPIALETVQLTGAILIIVGTATAMSWAITQSGFAQDLTSFMRSIPGGTNTFMAVSIVVFMLLGSLLEGIPAIVLFGPLLFPIARQLGIHEVHYAMVAIIAMGIGLLAPPFGVGYYIACAIGRVEPAEGVGKIGTYLLALLLGLVIVAFIPWLSIGFL